MATLISLGVLASKIHGYAKQDRGTTRDLMAGRLLAFTAIGTDTDAPLAWEAVKALGIDPGDFVRTPLLNLCHEEYRKRLDATTFKSAAGLLDDKKNVRASYKRAFPHMDAYTDLLFVMFVKNSGEGLGGKKLIHGVRVQATEIEEDLIRLNEIGPSKGQWVKRQQELAGKLKST